MNPFVTIDNVKIGIDYPTYFIADIAANHDGDLERAKNLIRLAKESGASAVKFQHHDVKKYVSDYGFKQLGGKMSHQGSWQKSIFEVYKDAEVPLDWTTELKKCADSLGITFFTTPYDLDIMDQLDPYVSAYKIGSGDMAWDAMLKKVASKGKPVIIATGASKIGEVQHAVEVLKAAKVPIVLMQCNTNYTASKENLKYINLNVLKTYHAMFPDVVLGLSDHTHGDVTVLGAIALGANVVEKHFTDDTSRNGPDHKFSMDPTTWKEMVDRSEMMRNALGGSTKDVVENERQTVVLQRRAIRVIKDIEPGQVITSESIQFQRPAPADAFTPNEVEKVLNRKAKKKIEAGDYIKLDQIDW